MTLTNYVRTTSRLGWLNILRVLFYKLITKIGLFSINRLRATIDADTGFFPQGDQVEGVCAVTELRLFSSFPLELESCPNWFTNYCSKVSIDPATSAKPWWQIPDFSTSVGDIKTVWELSRFDWAISFAMRGRGGQTDALYLLNHWLVDWCEKNPPFIGPNWKCGQEAAIRVIHVALAALILGSENSLTASLQQFLAAHLKRIRPTLMYALAQDNNHGTSEAAALFIGGEWLKSQGHKEGESWSKIGRYWLNERAQKLILADGSFSQYSVTYHRLMLDTYSVVLLWVKRFGLLELEPNTLHRLRLATNWLFQVTDPINGDAPNYGENDGAHLLTHNFSNYRDFRVSVNFASCMLDGYKLFNIEGALDELICVHSDSNFASSRHSSHFAEGGYVTLVNARAFLFLSYPRYKFRPGQSDAMHLDFSLDGRPILRDNGSYSYNCAEADRRYFSGTKSHNTIEFDSRDQMPRLGRFLYGSWLKARGVKFDADEVTNQLFESEYKDWKGAEHHRAVVFSDCSLEVIDRIQGFEKEAVLRWHLFGTGWQQEGGKFSNGRVDIIVTANIDLQSLSLASSDCSKYYMSKESMPVIEARVSSKACIKTEFRY